MDLKKWGFTVAAITMTATAASAGLLHDAPPTNTVPTLQKAPAVAVIPPPAVVRNPPAVAALKRPGEEASARGSSTPMQETPARRSVGAFAAAGRSDGTVLLAIIGVDYQFDKQWQLGDSGQITPIGELEVSYWEGNEGHTGVSSLHEAGAVCIARYRYLRTPFSSIRPFLDLGIGIHYVTETEIERKELGRNWLASSNIGAGFLFGRDERFEVGARIRHLSNAGTDEVNWGVNQLLARIGYRF